MAESSVKGTLPHGWQVKTSTHYPDRVYYFNVFTGSTTWECPVLDPPKEVVKEIKEMGSSQLLHKKLSKAQEKEQHKTLTSDKAITEKKTENPSTDSLKASAVPTAVVVPVVKKPIQFSVSAKPKLLPLNVSSVKEKDSQKLKRKIHFDDADTILNKCLVPKKRRNRGRKTRNKTSLSTYVDQKKTYKDNRVESINSASKSRKLSINAQHDTAPSEKTVEDVEMIDVSMEIIEDLTAKTETVFDTVASYYIVADTNVLISELSLINELKDTPMKGCGPPHIFIPWIVIQELDKLKSNCNKKNISRPVNAAVSYLNKVLSKHPRFHGQSPIQAEQWAKPFSECNDDKILECCLALGDKMGEDKVILLTNDKNLANKGFIMKLNVQDSSTMIDFVKPDITIKIHKKHCNVKKNKSSEDKKGITTETICAAQPEDKYLEECSEERSAYMREIHTLMCTARQLLKNNLARFMDFEMDKAYGSKWLSFPVERNLLDGILAGILKYWKMVFSEFMTEKDKRNFELLLAKVSQPAGFLAEDKEECLVILSSVEDVFRAIKRRQPKINVPIEKIQEFRIATVDAFYAYSELDKKVKEAEEKSALALFERDWAALNQLCGVILDSCGVQHEFPYDVPSVMIPDTQVRQIMCDLYPAVQQLKVQMFTMLSVIKECKPTKDIMKKLSQTLLNFIPSMKLPYEHFTCPHFSPRALEIFCTNPENRKMIEIGCKQVEKYYKKLDEALVSLMSSNKKRCTSPKTMICD